MVQRCGLFNIKISSIMENTSPVSPRRSGTKNLMTSTSNTITTANGDKIPIQPILEGIYDSVFKSGLSYDEKMDAFQDACIRLQKYAHSIDPRKLNPQAYGKTIGRNTVLNCYHRKAKDAIPFSSLNIGKTDGFVDAALEKLSAELAFNEDYFIEEAHTHKDRMEKKVMVIMHSLKGNDWTIMDMRYNKGMKYGEISSKLGINEGTVRQKANRARTTIRKELVPMGSN